MITALLYAALLSSPPAFAADRRTPVVLAVERAAPAVVSIETEVSMQSPFALLGAAPYETTSQGSGVIIDSKGVVLTNAHVVSGATSIRVHSADKRSWTARVVGLDPDLDLAVLSLEGASELPTIPMGSSAGLMLGETVIAIGNPYGLGQTVSTGVVSSTQREVEITQGTWQTYVQTDAPINPGNSGGALVDIDGNLIGINTAIFGGAEGIGFAIPVDRARKVASDMVAYGEVRAPWLGVDLRTVSQRKLVGTPLSQGAVQVSKVYSGSPADKAGIKGGDLIYLVDARPARSVLDLNAALAEKKPGDKLEVAFYRGTQSMKATLAGGEVPPDIGKAALKDTLGVDVAEKNGVLVVTAMRATGSWTRAGLQVNDTILAVNGKSVRTQAELETALTRAKAQHRATALITVGRGRYRGDVTLDI